MSNYSAVHRLVKYNTMRSINTKIKDTFFIALIENVEDNTTLNQVPLTYVWTKLDEER